MLVDILQITTPVSVDVRQGIQSKSTARCLSNENINVTLFSEKCLRPEHSMSSPEYLVYRNDHEDCKGVGNIYHIFLPDLGAKFAQ